MKNKIEQNQAENIHLVITRSTIKAKRDEPKNGYIALCITFRNTDIYVILFKHLIL